MWERKELKKNAKHSLKLNYIACIAVCFIMVFIAGEYQSSVQYILKYDNRNVTNLKYDAEQKAQIVKEIEEQCGGDLEKADKQTLDNAIDSVAEKYEIKHKDKLNSWVEAYKQKGISALNFREVTFFGATGETSNWRTVKRTLEMFGSDTVKVEKRVNLTEDQISYLFDLVTKNVTSEIGVVCYLFRLVTNNDTIRALIYLLCALLSLLVAVFVAAPLNVGERRFFLENRTYHGTNIGRIGFLFKVRYFKPTLIMLLRNIYVALWSFTVVGGIIKYYEYHMIPFILAENPKIDRKKAFSLSKQMMMGNKWKCFLLDASFYPWVIITSIIAAGVAVLICGFTFNVVLAAEICSGILMIMFLNPYKTATKAELYIVLRKQAIINNYEFSEELNDEYLDLDLLEESISNLNTDSELITASSDM